MPDPIDPNAPDPNTPDPNAPDPNAPDPNAPDPNTPDPNAPDPKDNARSGFEMRQLQKQRDDFKKELDAYKQREDSRRKETLTKEQQLEEERNTAVKEREEYRIELLRTKVAYETKLPAELAVRLIGTDEESLRADAEALLKLVPKPRIGAPTDPSRGSGQARVYKRSELQADPTLAASPEVRKAATEGRVIDG